MSLNYQRLYDYRFRDVDQDRRQLVWTQIARHLYQRMGRPDRVLDPAAGRCEFMNAIPAAERWVVDSVDHEQFRDPGIKSIVADALAVELPDSYFDGIFVSNFLEHLTSQEQVAVFLSKMYQASDEGGVLAVMGPNFKYCSREYFDCADHTLALTHVAVSEHVYAAGYSIVSVTPRFLPYSFRGVLPPSPTLTRAYLHMPLAWRLLGKQFLVLATRT
jgi:ubiquinone/menaquinone biosynthesis C-methylase UbiE